MNKSRACLFKKTIDLEKTLASLINQEREKYESAEMRNDME